MHAETLVATLKKMLRGRGITYASLARQLDLSEASVKRMFSRGDFTLQRLDEVCRAAEIDFAELARAASQESGNLSRLTLAQEQALVADPKLLLVALCAVGSWTLDQIAETYAMPRVECIGYLAQLDRLRIIELAPDNRIRPLMGRTFTWLPDGPIQRYFRDRIEHEFLGSKFDLPDELFLFVSGMLSRRSLAELVSRLRKVVADFAELHRDDIGQPPRDRHGTSLLLAMRPWEPRAFRALRREDRSPVPMGVLLPPPPSSARPAKRRQR
jgi:DNA-binding Xre family transcriptional regulator